MSKKLQLIELKVESFATQLDNQKLKTAKGGTQTIATGDDTCVRPTRGIIICTGT